MIDPFVLLTPILLLAVFALVRFIGCFDKPPRPPGPPTPNPVGTPNGDTGTTNQFSTTDKLLLAFVAADQDVVTGLSTSGLSFALVVKETGGGGTAEIWQAVASGPLNGVVVTANLSTPGVSAFVYVVSFSAKDGDGNDVGVIVGNTGHQSGSNGNPKATLTTTRDDSLVFGVGLDFDSATTPQEGANQEIVQRFLDPNPPGDTYWVQKRTDSNAANTQLQIDDALNAGDRWNLCVCEICVV